MEGSFTNKLFSSLFFPSNFDNGNSCQRSRWESPKALWQHFLSLSPFQTMLARSPSLLFMEDRLLEKQSNIMLSGFEFEIMILAAAKLTVWLLLVTG